MDDTLLDTKNYSLFGCDITDINLLHRNLLRLSNVDFKQPTLILSECVLTYIDPAR